MAQLDPNCLKQARDMNLAKVQPPAGQKSCIVIDSLCGISPDAKRLTGLMFGGDVIRAQLEKIGQRCLSRS